MLNRRSIRDQKLTPQNFQRSPVELNEVRSRLVMAVAGDTDGRGGLGAGCLSSVDGVDGGVQGALMLYGL